MRRELKTHTRESLSSSITLLRVGKNLFTVFDLNPGRMSFVDNWILNICVIALGLSWENSFSVFEVFHLNLRYIINHIQQGPTTMIPFG